MKRYKAFIFDLNGTMVDDMHYHESAWYNVLVGQLQAPMSKEEIRSHVYGKAEEMFERIFGTNKFTAEEVKRITDEKERKYREDFKSQLKLINGLQSFLDKAKVNGVALAIGTAAPPLNVDFAVDGLDIRSFFPVIIGANDVTESKPHPEVFLKAAKALGVNSENCVVFEDAPKGIEAAARAGMKAVGITSHHPAIHLKNSNVLFTIGDYTDLNLNTLF